MAPDTGSSGPSGDRTPPPPEPGQSASAQRLSALLWVDDGRSQGEVAELAGRDTPGRPVAASSAHGDSTPSAPSTTRAVRANSAPPGRATQGRGRHGPLPQLRPDPPLDRGDLRRHLLAAWDARFAPHRRQLPQGDRLLVEGRPGQAEGVRQEVPAAEGQDADGQATRGGISWMPAIRSGGWTWSIPAGCWSGSGFWWAWAAVANG